MFAQLFQVQKKFNTSESRDDYGRWTTGGASIGDDKGNLNRSLGIERKDMPQIRAGDHAEFAKFAKTKGVVVEQRQVKASALRPAQKEYNQEQADQVTPEVAKYPPLVSSDNYILDGTHRWVYVVQRDPNTVMTVDSIGLKAKEALALMHDFPKAGRKDVADVGTTEEVARQALHKMFDRIMQPDGGFTYQPVTKDEPTKGFALSIYPDKSFAKDAKDFSFDDLVNYAVSNKDSFNQKDHYIGAWHDPESHKVFLDVSVVKQDAKEAEELCKKHDQIAYFDLEHFKSVTVNRDATSGGVAKGEQDGQETGTAQPSLAEWWGRLVGRELGDAVQKLDRQGPDTGGIGTGEENLRVGSGEEDGFLTVFKFDPNPSRDDLGRFAKKGGGNTHSNSKGGYRSLFNPGNTQLVRETNKAIVITLNQIPPPVPPPRGKRIYQTGVHDLTSLYEKAKVGDRAFRDKLSEIQSKLRAKTVEVKTAEDFNKVVATFSSGVKGPVIIIAGMKNRNRLIQKVNNDYSGHFEQVGDVVRGTIAVDSFKEVPKVLEGLKSAGIRLARDPVNRFEKPTDEDYRDVIMNLNLPNGHVAELQVNTKAMVVAKEKAHHLYEQQRTIAGAASHDKREQTPEERKKIAVLITQQKRIYDAAWEASGIST